MLSKALVLKRQAYQRKCNFHFEGCLLWKRKNKPIFHRRDLSWGHWRRCEWWSSFSTFLSQQAFSARKFLLRRHFFCRRWCPLTWGGPEESLMLHPFFHAPLRKVGFQKMCYASANLLRWKPRPVQKLQELWLLKKAEKSPPNPLTTKGPSTKAGMDSFWPTPPSSKSPVFLVFHIVISWVPVNQTAAPFPLRWIQLLLLVPKTSSQPKKKKKT